MARKRSSWSTVSREELLLFCLFWVQLILVHYADAMYGKRFAGVLDSVKQGKRLGESAYNVIENEVSAVGQRQRLAGTSATDRSLY
jgi:hypothetical protein